jgi:hypothetical protein
MLLVFFWNSASPVVEGEPRSSIMGIGFHRSTGVKLEAEGSLMLLVTLAVVSLSKSISLGLG